MKIFTIMLLFFCNIAFASNYKMKCEDVSYMGNYYFEIWRCENDEVFCYQASVYGKVMSCFKK